MKTNTVIGLILVALGIAAFAFQGITYTTREKAVDLGPIQVTTEKSRHIPLPPIVGGVALVCGAVMLITAGRKG
ncbi:MAG TPA: DUF3185 domain-containing protein [Candidatus Sumerlaeota bacterium]|nr:DUF3185 domain-containing protein [Candidatus Sumerlaeota bacterium]HPS01287.1 DUF3185 domain-containing protein [Candidatus Sumerlaeota bacterium]